MGGLDEIEEMAVSPIEILEQSSLSISVEPYPEAFALNSCLESSS